jgi:hypothetical protein
VPIAFTLFIFKGGNPTGGFIRFSADTGLAETPFRNPPVSSAAEPSPIIFRALRLPFED